MVDADAFTTWIPLQPGGTLPFDMTGWGPLNNIRGLWDTISAQGTIVVRVEPFLTWTSVPRVAPLPVQDDSVSFANGQAEFTGNVIKNLGSSIINGQVIAVVWQKASAEIVATGLVHLDISASSARGQVFTYDLAVQIPTDLDPASLVTEVDRRGTTALKAVLQSLYTTGPPIPPNQTSPKSRAWERFAF